MRGTHLLIGLIVSAALVAGCSSPSTPAEIASQRCTKCHTIDRIKTATHDPAAWKVTIDAMRSKGAALTDAQAQQVISFLAAGGASGL